MLNVKENTNVYTTSEVCLIFFNGMVDFWGLKRNFFRKNKLFRQCQGHKMIFHTGINSESRCNLNFRKKAKLRWKHQKWGVESVNLWRRGLRHN